MSCGTFQDCCYQCPCPKVSYCWPTPPQRRSNSSRQVCSSAPVWGQCFFPLGLGRDKICLYPPRLESCVTQSCSAHNQIPLASRLDSLGFPNSLLGFLLGSLTRASELDNSGRTSLLLLFSSLCGCPPARYGIWILFGCTSIILLPLWIFRCGVFLFLFLFLRAPVFSYGEGNGTLL